MKPQRLNSGCIECLLEKHLIGYPENSDEKQKIEYMQRLLKLLSETPVSVSAPELLDEINTIKKEMFGFAEDFSEIKRHFNGLMLNLEAELTSMLQTAEDPLALALHFAMVGNYIDFGVLKDVDEEKLKALLLDSDRTKIDSGELEMLKTDLDRAKTMVYLTDNCGEIVLDKILISHILKRNPELELSVIVRGAPVLNDATLEDAKQIGLEKLVPVFDNGSGIAGTCLDRISETAKEKINGADVLIAKGQANFETLQLCGKNIYYVFMCKCKMFAERFGVPRYSGMLLNDLRI